MRKRSVSESDAYTIIEVLVTLGVLSVLAAIVFPVLLSARQKAWETACANNLRQLGAAMEMYLQDHDEVFPPSYVVTGPGTFISWREVTRPYVRNLQIVQCPAWEHRGAKAEALPPELRATYAMNVWLSPPDFSAVSGAAGEPLGLAAVRDCTGTILLCDAGYSNLPLALDFDHYLVLGMQEQVLPTERHHQGANFLFVDGHVKKLTEPMTRSPEYLWDP